MDKTELALIELKCLILDVLYQKRLEGMDEVPVTELLDGLGMTVETNLTGLDPNDTIMLTGKSIENIEATKAQLRRGNSIMH
jgi:hypothetical protein